MNQILKELSVLTITILTKRVYMTGRGVKIVI